MSGISSRLNSLNLTNQTAWRCYPASSRRQQRWGCHQHENTNQQRCLVQLKTRICYIKMKCFCKSAEWDSVKNPSGSTSSIHNIMAACQVQSSVGSQTPNQRLTPALPLPLFILLGPAASVCGVDTSLIFIAFPHFFGEAVPAK